MQRIRAIDSHTGGEPTRVVLEGEIPLLGATMAERRDDLVRRFDGLRAGLVREPRGGDVWVGAVLTPPVSAEATCGVVFFTTVGPLGMCGHGTIGVVETLRHMGRIGPGPVAIDTPVGTVRARLGEDGRVTIQNVRSYRYRKDIEIEGPSGPIIGDIAWGGNWFFLVKEPKFDVALANVSALTTESQRIARTLQEAGIAGESGALIDHVELFGPKPDDADSINFVLCPGGSYDRSPCGTGTSAKLASLYADGALAPGQIYRQKGVTGSVFEGSVESATDDEGGVIPTIAGRAWVTAETTFLFQDTDPLREGL